jgi:putative flippase GtrA
MTTDTISTYGQFIRYVLVGLTSNSVLFLGYLALTSWGITPKIAMSGLYALGLIQTFAFNRGWTFKHEGSKSATSVKYFTSYGFGYLLNLLILTALVDQLGFPHQIVQGGATIALAFMLFGLQKYWVFR